jgi:hypothetical protein
MDRPDERRDRHDHDDEGERDTHDPRDEGVLGIGDANPPRDRVPREGDRALRDEAPESRPGSRDVEQTPGATGIDMGAGGTGTDVERD